jgi:hypothetical protein
MTETNTNDTTTISLEQILGEFAVQVNNEVGKAGKDDKPEHNACSVFLYDHRRDAYVLRASTLGSNFLGKAQLDTSEKKRQLYEDKKQAAGLTVTAIFSKKPVTSKGDQITEDNRSTSFGKGREQLDKDVKSNYCEFNANEICSLIAVPIFFKPDIEPNKNPDGVVRVVRHIESSARFNDENVESLQKLIEQKRPFIQSSAFLSKLIELGSHMDLPSLCKQSAEVFRDILGGKGCSIILLDEDASDEDRKIYKCFGTTGKVKLKESEELVEEPFKDERTWYIYLPKENQQHIYNSNEYPLMDFTTGVIRARICVFIDNIYDYDIEKLFPYGYGIRRSMGPGLFSEYLEVDGEYKKTQSMLYAPMFYCDPGDSNVEVLGVVRVGRPEGFGSFSIIQRHLFVSMVESLSKAINFARLVEFIDKVAQKTTRAELFKYVVENIPKFVGAKDCALLLKDGDRLDYGAEWKDGKAEFEPKYRYPYDLLDEDERGYTGFVALTGKSLLFNGKEELEKVVKDMDVEIKAIHRDSSGPGTYRFLGVPIPATSEGEVVAVLRVCKDENSSRFTEEDRKVLILISKRLLPHIKEIVRVDEEARKCKRIKDHYFSSELQKRIRKLEDPQYSSATLVKDFLSGIRAETRIESAISDFITELWNFYRQHDERSDDILKDFEFFNDKILSDIPHYRDHFIHQFVVYLIGLTIIGSIGEEFVKIFERSYPKALKRYSSADGQTKRKFVERAWLITALFHDVAYPLETVNLWLQKIIEKFLRGPAVDVNSLMQMQSVLFAPDYIDRLDQLAKFHSEYFEKKKTCELRTTMVKTIMGNKPDTGLDHGLMGALLLLGDDRFNTDELLPCASAIALHNRLLLNSSIDKITFEKHPLAFLLLYCDLLHEWGRGEPETDRKNFLPRLNKFWLLVPWRELIDDGVDINHVEEDKRNEIKWIFATGE